MKRKNIIIIFGILFLIGTIYLVAAQISPSLNFNGFNQFSITNYTEITGIGNISVGSGTETLDIYSNGTTNIFDSLGYNISFTDGVHWTELTEYPAACPSGSYLSQLDDAATCTAISTIPNEVTVGSSSSEYFIFGTNSTAMTCGEANAGAIYYNNDTNKHYGCNVTAWQELY